MTALLLALLLGAARAEPSDATLVYYNARMALREEHAAEATKLWLLRNTLAQQTDHVSPYDEDFHSVIWASLGATGLCQDGLRSDKRGAGLWPLALHNWVVRNRGRRSTPKARRVFDAFDVGRQQRRITAGDVLDLQELQTVRFQRGRCFRPGVELLVLGEAPGSKLTDRQVAGRYMLHLLQTSKRTLSQDHVRGISAVDARIFDVQLQLAGLAEREAEREQRGLARLGRQVGLGRPSIEALRSEARATALELNTSTARVLERTLTWSTADWMALSSERRRYLFDRSTAFNGPHPSLHRAALGIIDALIERNEGAELEAWIPRYGADLASQSDLWRGDRGRRLLALDAESGFGERSVIALNRGIEALEGGDLSGSLRALAFALQTAPESADAQTVASLSLRWLTYVASQAEITDELLITLQELVPRREYGILLEDLMWSAAFYADNRSFERGSRNLRGRGALQRRLHLLQPLAQGKIGPFLSGLRTGLTESPSETLGFIEQLVQRLELENADVRTDLLPTLRSVRELIAPLADEEDGGRFARRAQTVLDRAQAITDGLEALDEDASLRDRAYALAPGGEVFAGSVRLAPVDTIPWPFTVEEVKAPSIFEPLDLVPVEWRNAEGDWVYGWEIRG